ncbi:MAG TPA: hypothetical protein VGC35_04780 [Allosphingosinicella sp.]|jgi:hypothetical protein
MGKRMMAGAAAVLALAGCEDGAPQPQRTAIKAANPTSDQLTSLSPIYRFLGLRRAIVDNGQRCKKVDRGHFQQEYQNMAMWTANCTDSGEWAVFIAPNGNVQVRRCGNLASIKLPACRPIPADEGAEPSAGDIRVKAAKS